MDVSFSHLSENGKNHSFLFILFLLNVLLHNSSRLYHNAVESVIKWFAITMFAIHFHGSFSTWYIHQAETNDGT